LLFYQAIKNKIFDFYFKRRRHKPKKITAAILSGIALTVSVQIGITPICTIYFNKITLIGIVSNLIVMPLIPVLSYIGYFMLIVIFFFEPFGIIIFEILKLPTQLLILISRIMATMKFGIIQAEGFSMWLTTIYYAILIYIFKLRKVKHSKKIAATIAAVATIVFIINIYGSTDRKLEIVFLDVGQGDCIFIQSADGKNILVDVGEKAEPILSYLKYRGISTIDIMFATHNHSDHVGALPEVKNSINIKQLVGTPAVGGTFVGDGATIKVGNELEFEVHNPPIIDSEKLTPNNQSLMLKMKYKSFTLMLSGDCESEAEALAEQAGEDLSAGILKVGHHGSKTASTVDFLNRVRPSIAVISVGENNLYGHPSEDTLSKLRNMGITVYRTDKNGAIMVDTDGVKTIVNVMIK
jgi:competence protein ComEC